MICSALPPSELSELPLAYWLLLVADVLELMGCVDIVF